MKHLAVAGIFESHQSISTILADLRAKNFQMDDISVENRQNDKLQTLPQENYILQTFERALIVSVAMGGVIGLLLGVGLIPDPGDVFIPAGPVLSALAGIGIGATIGSLMGVFMALFMNQKDKSLYDSLIQDKGFIVSVHVNNKREELIARNVLVGDGAKNVISPQNG